MTCLLSDIILIIVTFVKRNSTFYLYKLLVFIKKYFQNEEQEKLKECLMNCHKIKVICEQMDEQIIELEESKRKKDYEIDQIERAYEAHNHYAQYLLESMNRIEDASASIEAAIEGYDCVPGSASIGFNRVKRKLSLYEGDSESIWRMEFLRNTNRR